MTIASEITRLQWAKADIKTAIESKWVTVPANAKLDTYDDYIWQIQTWWALTSGLSVAYKSTWWYFWPSCWAPLSFEEGGKYYCIFPWIQMEKSWYNSYFWMGTYRKLEAGQDLEYGWRVTWYYFNQNYSQNYISDQRYYTDWTTIVCYSFCKYTPTTNPDYYMMCKSTWNYKTTAAPSRPTLVWTSTSLSTNPEDYWESLVWYTELSVNSSTARVASAIGYRDDWWYVYLVLR